MRDPFAFVVWILGTGVMAYGFSAVVGRVADWMEWLMVAGGLVACCIGAYAVGRANAKHSEMG